jgi:hypothetical protein
LLPRTFHKVQVLEVVVDDLAIVTVPLNGRKILDSFLPSYTPPPRILTFNKLVFSSYFDLHTVDFLVSWLLWYGSTIMCSTNAKSKSGPPASGGAGLRGPPQPVAEQFDPPPIYSLPHRVALARDNEAIDGLASGSGLGLVLWFKIS